ncbi:MAG: biotin--[acetyl-CoA-carboxylase] ligase, partial [Pseudomonadota bacterium]
MEAGASGSDWIWAVSQTAGVGRRGRAWASREGDLACTLVTPAPENKEESGQLAFVAALAAHDAISAFVAEEKVALKWPNDVLIEGAKAAGLLLELWGGKDGRAMLGVGIGINIVSRPEDTPYPATRLLDHVATGRGDALGSAACLGALMKAWDRRRQVWDQGGFEPIRADWLARAWGLGGEIRVRTPSSELSGRFEGLDEVGRLLLT